MLSKITKIILILSALILIAGCTPEEPDSSADKENNCGYKYTYTCGFNAMTGRTECNHGYYYVCY